MVGIHRNMMFRNVGKCQYQPAHRNIELASVRLFTRSRESAPRPQLPGRAIRDAVTCRVAMAPANHAIALG
jgi:hypothetical protein